MKIREATEVEINQLQPSLNNLFAGVEAIVQFSNNNEAKAGAEIGASVNAAKIGIYIGLNLAIFLCADGGIYLSNSLSNSLQKNIASLCKGRDHLFSVSGQMNQSSQQMDKLAQVNAAKDHETASSSEELSGQAAELKDMVDDLVAIVSGSSPTFSV